ncbi:CAMP factor family pore-forming toxin [Arcanobacterium buesumense]|uniref:cAMP factor family pore-forming toxin n=1 Tax=Arcanobacterium buesumense TaxID=2722751 RepID=A0A6H2EJP8_9ACTO|nr:CAMP factor family pore-forming toxin [Arcanobacterium buesumense]QJC21069.1 CAMP factor family pore-forming toxin [Arcanobacterium buesumense]
MLKPIISVALSASLILPMAGTTAYATTPVTNAHIAMAATDDSSVQNVREEAKEKAAEVAETMTTINEAVSEVRPEVAWSKEFKQLFATLAELKSELIALSTGNIAAFDTETILTRAELATNIGVTIDTAVNKLNNKVQAAHAELGFAITRAVLRLTNITATDAQLKDSIADLETVLNRVSQYPDVLPTDIATVYVKSDLTKKIWDTRWNRDKNILGKKSFATYHALNKKITAAVGVEFNARATVQQVRDAIESLDVAYATALDGE